MIKTKEEKILIKPKDIKPSSKKFKVLGVFNPAAIRMPNGEIILYVRVAEKLIKDEDEKYYYSPRMVGKKKFEIALDKFNKELVIEKDPMAFIFKDGTKRLTFVSHLKKVVLDKSGMKIKSIEKKPSFYGLSWDGELGVEDPRITKIGNLYLMTYVSLTKFGNVSTSLATSTDCKKWQRKGIIFREQNKDVVIFPELINGKYVAFNRPEGGFEFSSPHIWISHSKDLEYWGKPKSLILSKKPQWDSGKVGAGPPPIKTDKGWLFIYHGVKEHHPNNNLITKIKKLFGYEEKKDSYNAGAVLLDLKNPSKILAKSKNPIIIPRKKYEKENYVGKEVVFPTGLILDENKKDILLYSGGGDEVTTVKKISLKEIFNNLKKS